MKISWTTFPILCSALLFRCGDGFQAVGLVSGTSNTPLPAHYRKSPLPAHYRKSRTLAIMSSPGGNNDNGDGGGPAYNFAFNFIKCFMFWHMAFKPEVECTTKHDPEMRALLKLVMKLIGALKGEPVELLSGFEIEPAVF